MGAIYPSLTPPAPEMSRVAYEVVHSLPEVFKLKTTALSSHHNILVDLKIIIRIWKKYVLMLN